MSAQICQNCGGQLVEGAQFCTTCGREVVAEVCQACGVQVPAGASFCTNCGKEVAIRVCQACGARLPEGTRFCTNCGKEVVFPPHSEKAIQAPLVSEFTKVFPTCPICGSASGYDATRKFLTYYVRCRLCGAVWQPFGSLGRYMDRLLLVEPDKDMRASSLVRKSDRWHKGYGYKVEFWKSLDLGG